MLIFFRCASIAPAHAAIAALRRSACFRGRHTADMRFIKSYFIAVTNDGIALSPMTHYYYIIVDALTRSAGAMVDTSLRRRARYISMLAADSRDLFCVAMVCP